MKFNFEGDSGYRAPQEEVFVSTKDIDEAFNRAEKILSNPIDPKGFTHIYGDNVKKDMDYVASREARFAEEQKRESPEAAKARKMGKIFEAIVFEQSEMNEWLGETATTIEAARWDDIVNGVDSIVEFEEGPSSASHLALAMDVTVSGRTSDKFGHIKQHIDSGKLTTIKYFESDFLNIKGEKSLVPHVVIGVDKKTLYDLVDAWVKKDQKRLAAHPVQIKILEEMRVQMEAFGEYAKQTGQDKILQVYKKTQGIIEEIMNGKQIKPADIKEAYLFDDVMESIRFNAKHIGDRK